MRGKLSPETLEDLAALTASIQAHPTTLHARVADADRTRAVEPPTYRPGNPMWEAGYASARAQAAQCARDNEQRITHHPAGYVVVQNLTAPEIADAILAMRPTAPKGSTP